jgi:hypothetical protein
VKEKKLQETSLIVLIAQSTLAFGRGRGQQTSWALETLVKWANSCLSLRGPRSPGFRDVDPIRVLLLPMVLWFSKDLELAAGSGSRIEMGNLSLLNTTRTLHRYKS